MLMARAGSDIIRYRILIAGQEGADVAAILAAAGAPPGFMEGDIQYVSLDFERRVWRAILAALNREDIGLVCGARFPTQAINILGYVMANAPTIRVAFEKCCRFQRLIGDSLGMEMTRGTDTTWIRVTMKEPWYDELRYTIDLMMAAWQSWASANAPAPVLPRRVEFRYQRPENFAQYVDHFAPSPVVFDAPESAQEFDNAALDQPVIGANREMFALFDAKVAAAHRGLTQKEPLIEKVRARLLTRMKADPPQIDLIASDLAMSVRKLQQGLAGEGSTFSEVLATTRCDLAKSYLSDRNVKVGNDEIAYLLGYSEVSVFSRSFKKWTGQTPSAFRAVHT